jgi:hypothetical protein
MWILAVGKENFSFFLLKSNKRILMKGDWQKYFMDKWNVLFRAFAFAFAFAFLFVFFLRFRILS